MSPAHVKQNIKILYKQAEKLRDQGVYFQAVELFQKLLPLYKIEKDDFKYGRSLLQIGLCYRMANKNNKAQVALKKAVKYFAKRKNMDRIGYTYRELGTVYLNMNEFKSANEPDPDNVLPLQ